MSNLQKQKKPISMHNLAPGTNNGNRNPIKPLLRSVLSISDLKTAKIFTKQGLLRKRDQKIVFRPAKLEYSEERNPHPVLSALKLVGKRLHYLKRLLLDFSNQSQWAQIKGLHSILKYFNAPKDLRISFPTGFGFHDYDFRVVLKEMSRFGSLLETLVFNIRGSGFTNISDEDVPSLANAFHKMCRLKVLSIELDGSGEIALCDGDSDPLWRPISRMGQLKFFRFFDYTIYEDPGAGAKSDSHFAGLCNAMKKLSNLRGLDFCFANCNLTQEVMKDLSTMLTTMKWLEYVRILLHSIEASFGKPDVNKIVDAFKKHEDLKSIYLSFGGSKKVNDNAKADLERKFQKLTGLPNAKLEIFVYNEDDETSNKAIARSCKFKRFLGCYPFFAKI